MSLSTMAAAAMMLVIMLVKMNSLPSCKLLEENVVEVRVTCETKHTMTQVALGLPMLYLLTFEIARLIEAGSPVDALESRNDFVPM